MGIEFDKIRLKIRQQAKPGKTGTKIIYGKG